MQDDRGARFSRARNVQVWKAMTDKARVLIVEDDSEVRRLVALGLNQNGYEVKLAANGAQALDRILADRPDVILLDWMMPLMNGDEVLDRISADHLPPIPVIVISGQPAPEGAALDPRIRCWLKKPVTIREVIRQISMAPGQESHAP
jgi:CheY-like chemotaxis protein